MGQEDQEADDDGDDGAEEDGPGCHVFGGFGQGAVFGRGQVDAEFKDSVEHFGGEDGDDGEEDDGKLYGRDAQEETDQQGEQRNREVDPHVALRAQGIPEAAESIAKAVDEFRPLAFALHGLFWP